MPTTLVQEQARPGIDALEAKARVRELLSRWPAVGLAVGVVRNGRLEFFSGHGLADIASNTPITQDTVFRIASITKTVTALAVLQLEEQGLVDLDGPANQYLRAFTLLPAKASFRPATVRQLLTHTAGLPEVVHPSRTLRYAFGESFKLDEPLPTLAEYYRGGLRLVTEPGTTFRYTDHSFATLGQLVEDVSGTPLDRYLRERIFDPLGMADTDLLRSERVSSRLATGYILGAKGPKAVTDRQWVTAAASSIYSTPRDMARYLAALLGGGTGVHGSVLKPATLAMLFEPQYRPDPRVPGIGLAFSRFSLGGHLAVEHEGILPGFNSDIFLAPDDGVGVMAFTNGARQAMLWLPAEAGRLLSWLLGVPDEAIRTDVPQHPELWGELCGWYRLPAPLTDTRARSIFGLGAEVFVRRGQLMVRALSPIPAVYNGFVLHPDDDQDPYVFRIDLSQFGIGTARVIFRRDPATARMRVQLELYPLALQQQPASQNPRLLGTGTLGALAVGTTAVAVGRRRATRRRRSGRATDGRAGTKQRRAHK
jgi:CubicO group peptidase (beta-lactamase class C family)